MNRKDRRYLWNEIEKRMGLANHKCFQEQGGRKTGKGETEERNVDLELGR